MKLLALTTVLIFSACLAHAAGMAVESTVAQPSVLASPTARFNRTQALVNAVPREQMGKASAVSSAGVLAPSTTAIAQGDGQEAPAYALWALGMGLIGFQVRRRARA